MRILTGLLLYSSAIVSASTPATNCVPNVVTYDIIYVRAPRPSSGYGTFPDVSRPLVAQPGTELWRLHPDCTEDLLFPRPQDQSILDAPIGNGAAVDPNLSFDATSVVFAYYQDLSNGNVQRCQGSGGPGECLSYLGSDIYREDLNTGVATRLTHQEFTPNTGNGSNFNCSQQYTNCPNIGVFNTGPAFFARQDVAHPGIVFTSTRNDFLSPKGTAASRAMQLYRMDGDGKNVEQIGYLNNAQAMHPFQLLDGRLMFTSWESQGLRDDRDFNLWFIAPDGTGWASGSGLGELAFVHHFMTQTSNQDIVAVRYYQQNNNGFGDLIRYPVSPPGPSFLPVLDPNTYMPLQRKSQIDLTNWTSQTWDLTQDEAAPCEPGGFMYGETDTPCPNGDQNRVGKVMQPAVAPGDDILLVYTMGAANINPLNINTPYDAGIYLLPSAIAASGSLTPADLKLIVNDPAYDEQCPRAVVPYSAVFAGSTQPYAYPEYANPGDNGHGLAPNSPFGLIGSSSLTYRDTNARPGPYGPDPFNYPGEFQYNWGHQGADAGVYSDSDIYAVRIVTFEPSTDRTYPNGSPNFYNVGTERMRILGEIPARKTNAKGKLDTSFLARVPANIPLTFQTLDRNGMVLNMAQTWHQVRPGEKRYDCGGCHAHSKPPIPFNTTLAGQPGFMPTQLGLQTPLLQVTQLNGNPATAAQAVPQVTYEYMRDILPIIQNRCAGCHLDDTTDASLNLHADGTILNCNGGWYPGTYFRLAVDDNTGGPGCTFGLGPPPGPYTQFFAPQITRYMRGFQSRQSLLIWYMFGARLDGRTNATRNDDIDYTYDALHAGLLSWDEKMTMARWIDLGAPIQSGTPWGWLEDDLRPTLWVSPTVSEAQAGPVSAVTVGAYDLESGLASGTLRVSFNVAIGGQPAGTNFAAGINPVNGTPVSVALPAAVNLPALKTVMTVSIKDQAGQITTVVRNYK